MSRWLAVITLLVACPTSFAKAPKITIHEWGTFTNLQDEDGLSVGGINSDDEPLPKFTHTLTINGIIGDAASQRRNRLMQGYPQCHPDVTIRLETPVVYFYPEPGAEHSTIDFSVQFRGGYLTQFYPQAVAPKIENQISSQTIGSLDWPSVKLGTEGKLPETTSHVWTAPRNVNSATATVGGETEKFLFYRGVGHIDAPLRLIRNGSEIEIRGQLDSAFAKGTQLKIDKLWFCNFEDGGRCVFRELSPVRVSGDRQTILARTPANFDEAQPSAENLDRLKRAIHAALVEDGLFADEAGALLDTWELSYFKSSGVRLFYIVPREWTEHYLPVKTSASEIVRVMVGRIDLVTPEHRRLMKKIADCADIMKNKDVIWRIYERLGRFRNALILDEQGRRPGKSLGEFIEVNALGAR